MLQQQGTRIIVTTLVVMLAVWILFAFVRTTEEPASEPSAITLSHRFADGRHEFRGTIELPTPCHRLDVVAGTQGMEIEINLRTTATDSVCIQVIDTRDFYVQVNAPEEARPKLSFNGAATAVEVVPVP